MSMQPVQELRSARDSITGWPPAARDSASRIIDRYGEPDYSTPGMLVWERRGPWKEIIAHRDEVAHNFPVIHMDVLEQMIPYRVPPEKLKDLAEFDGSIIVGRTIGLISSTCDSEPMNFLAINLADDIVNNRLTVEEARKAFAEKALAAFRGEKEPYTEGLRFEPAGPEDTHEPDIAAEWQHNPEG